MKTISLFRQNAQKPEPLPMRGPTPSEAFKLGQRNVTHNEFTKEGARLRDSIAETDRGLMSHDARLCKLEKEIEALQKMVAKLLQ